MSAPLSNSQIRYYQRLDRLFALTTCVVLVVVWLGGYFLPIAPGQRFLFELVVLAGALFALYRYVYLSHKPYNSRRYYLTEIVNTTLIGLLMSVAGELGIYLYVLFFLQVVGSTALLKMRHLVVSTTLSLGWTIYFFGLTNTFGLEGAERWLTGMCVWVVLLGMTLFNSLIIWEVIRMFLDLEEQKEQFIQDASHELRTPLTVIKAAGTLLRDAKWRTRLSARSPKEQEEVVKHFESATEDLEKIAEKLSGNSRKRLDGPVSPKKPQH